MTDTLTKSRQNNKEKALSHLHKAALHHPKEDGIKREIANACEEIFGIHSIDTEWETGDGPVDIYLPGRRFLIECKATGKIDSNHNQHDALDYQGAKAPNLAS